MILGVREISRCIVRLFAGRERRLWLCTLAALAAIYASLGFAPVLAGELRDRGLIAPAFGLGMLLVGTAIVAQGVRARPRGAEIAVIVGMAAVYLLMFTRIASLEERTHLIEYGVVGLLINEALSERAGQGRRVPAPPLLAAAVTAMLGVLDEGIQAFLPNRVFDPRDILFNALAGAMAVGASAALAWARRRLGRAKAA